MEREQCGISGCESRWAVLLPSNCLSYRTADAICDGDDLARLCSVHYSKIRNSEGFILSYRYDRSTKRLRSYIKEWIM